MSATWRYTIVLGLFLAILSTGVRPALAEDEDEDAYSTSEESAARRNSNSEEDDAPPPEPVKKKRKLKGRRPASSKERRYFVPDPDRIDAGIFHVAFAVGGNFYIEPKFSGNARGVQSVPTGEFFKDFGFQAGVYFDYDYSALTENVPLGLRGMVGYKYILNSVHIFAFDGMARIMMRTSDRSVFGVGAGVSAAIWFRTITSTSATEQLLFLPSFVAGAGFEYNPFMVDFKLLIQNLSADATILGMELYFGIRL